MPYAHATVAGVHAEVEGACLVPCHVYISRTQPCPYQPRTEGIEHTYTCIYIH